MLLVGDSHLISDLEQKIRPSSSMSNLISLRDFNWFVSQALGLRLSLLTEVINCLR